MQMLFMYAIRAVVVVVAQEISNIGFNFLIKLHSSIETSDR